MTDLDPGPTIIDADSHIIETPDIWTSRIASKYHDQIPQVGQHPDTGASHWRLGDRWIHTVGALAPAGWNKPWPSHPDEYEECEKAAYDASARLRRLDEFGLRAQILYPNIVGFCAADFAKMDLHLSVLCVRAYNDFALDWCAADPKRLLPIAMLPFWDIQAAVAEVERCAELGFCGYLFANRLEQIGLPSFVDPSWDPLYAAIQLTGQSVNYHIAFNDTSVSRAFEPTRGQVDTNDSNDSWRQDVVRSGRLLLDQANLVGEILLSGLCDRFPLIKFVSVEAGFGYLPFYLDTLDWQIRYRHRSEMALLPSEYFRRQCYTTFWFEKTTLSLLELLPENAMFSTDYPHPVSLSPGPGGGTTLGAREWVAEAFAGVNPEARSKALSGNAARIYGLDLD